MTRVLVLFAVFWSLSIAADEILENADFAAGLDAWHVYGPAGSFEAVAMPGSAGRRVVRHTADGGDPVVHLDQVVDVKAETVYRASVRVLNRGTNLRPALRLAGIDWQTVAYIESTVEEEWETLTTVVCPADDGQLRFQLFGCGRANKVPGRQGNVLFAELSFREGTVDDLVSAFSAEIGIDPGVVVGKVDPLFFGVNSLFWITDDKARADGKIAASLRALNCRLIRFPGGEVADNYHWRTNTLDDRNTYPRSDGPDKLDFDEFMAWVGEIGAEPICVVNLESGFLHEDVEAGAQEAADWVRYSNVEKKYGVKYWEIGNETDLIGTRYPLTAAEYADAAVRFSQAMKAVDSTIMIGALGPRHPEHVAFIDTLTSDGVRQVRAMKPWEVKAKREELPHNEIPGPAWWPTLVGKAAAHVDFAIVHQYDSSRGRFSKALTPPLRLSENISALDAYLHKQFGREIPIALTEWNVWRNAQLDPVEHAITIAEQVGNYLTAGVDLANFWPMRFPRGKGQEYFRALLTMDEKEPQAVYYVLQMLSMELRPTLVQVRTSHRELYVLASTDEERDTIALFVVNRLGIDRNIATTVSAGRTILSSTGRSLVAGKTPSGSRIVDVTTEMAGEQCTMALPPKSLTVIKLTF